MSLSSALASSLACHRRHSERQRKISSIISLQYNTVQYSTALEYTYWHSSLHPLVMQWQSDTVVLCNLTLKWHSRQSDRMAERLPVR